MKPNFVIQIAGAELNRHPTEPLATINFANTSVALPVSFTAILLSRGNYTIKKKTALIEIWTKGGFQPRINKIISVRILYHDFSIPTR